MAARRDSLTMIAGAAALGAIYWFGVDRPQQGRLAALRTEIGLIREELAAGTTKADERKELGERILATEASLEDFEHRVPASAELGVFIAEVSGIADRLGLREQDLEPLGAESRGGLMVVPVRMAFVGPFDATFGFLRDVTEMTRIVRVSELKLERPEPFRGELKAQMTLQVFYEAA